MAVRPVTVAETDLFIRQAADIWNSPEREAFVDFIARNPEAGDVVQETGGVRKVRWRRAGSGKRGGVRVVYFYYNENLPLYLLMLYAKSDREDMTAEEKKAARKLTAALKMKAYKGVPR
ncbi:MAG TPA: type II toxin-antitoxin system RelE/ParE family toxin [Rhizomicrobium sp.]|nr:type II toxin-antitoxin system RelE/ParE family toxin [Rhizomicrobium sp.]